MLEECPDTSRVRLWGEVVQILVSGAGNDPQGFRPARAIEQCLRFDRWRVAVGAPGDDQHRCVDVCHALDGLEVSFRDAGLRLDARDQERRQHGSKRAERTEPGAKTVRRGLVNRRVHRFEDERVDVERAGADQGSRSPHRDADDTDPFTGSARA